MIILYHSIIPDGSPAERYSAGQALPQAAFERQIRWLAKHYTIVSLTDYVIAWQKREIHKEKLIAITFDDGFRMTFQCVFSFLTEIRVPCTVFVTTGHLEHGDLLWFSYLRALCFENLYPSIQANGTVFPLQTIAQRKQAWIRLHSWAKGSGDPVKFSKSFSEIYPLSSDVLALYEGMTYDQIKIVGNSPYIELGAHTVTHPYLDLLSKEEQEKEIVESKRVLAEITEEPIRYFAYPAGQYNHETLDLMKSAGYEASFAIIPKKLGLNPEFEIDRVGIYSQSLLKLRLKALGIANLARWAGLRVG